MAPFGVATAVARCVADTFTTPTTSLFGLKTLSITASVVSNVSLQLATGQYLSHAARNISGLDLCNVTVTTTHPGWDDSINTEVWLPLEGWNGRMQMTGGGGLSTGLSPIPMYGAVSDHYATVSTDGGHNLADPGSWALSSPGNVNMFKVIDYATVALHEAAVIGKAITRDYYDQAVAYSYFTGCSTGGRQGVMFAQIYPDDFEGILACSPGLDYARAITGGFYPMINLQDHGTFPAPCEIDSIRKVARDECDPKDGVTDGVISAPELCTLDPFSLVGTPASECPEPMNISYAAALGAHGAWTPTAANGSALYPFGLLQGAPLRGLVNTTCDESGRCQGVPFYPLVQWYKYFLAKDPEFDTSTLTVQQQYEYLNGIDVRLYSSLIETTSVNLGRFRDRGGKMITWHGFDDEYIPPGFSQTYYDNVTTFDPQVSDYYRYFQPPGVQHCFGGAGPYPVDGLEKLIEWVENGVAPASLHGISPPNANGVVSERPICPYPARARYTGKGDVAVWENWECH